MTEKHEIAAMDRDERRQVEDFRRAVREHTRKVTVSKEAAREELVRLGIYTPSGDLSENYK